MTDHNVHVALGRPRRLGFTGVLALLLLPRRHHRQPAIFVPLTVVLGGLLYFGHRRQVAAKASLAARPGQVHIAIEAKGEREAPEPSPHP